MVATALELSYLTIAEASEAFQRRELSPVDLTLAHLERIEQLQPTLRAFLTVTSDIALREARAAETALLRGDKRPLLGIPVGYKDIYMTAGVRTTGASMLYEHYVPDVTATAIDRLHKAGVVMLGKLHTHEFASGMTPEEHPFPPARNPWNTSRIPGGSSSGSGAGIAAGIAMGALGTDTGGSIRGPGSFCGIAALKPTYGRCSRFGVYTLSWSLDHTGPMARTVQDVAQMLNGMAGYDPKDPASANVPAEDYTLPLGRSIKGMRVGVLRSWYTPTADAVVTDTVEQALSTLAELGAEVVDVEVPHIRYTAAISAIMMPEAYAYHQADLMETPEKYAPQLRSRLLSGGLYLAHEYVNAQRARQILRQEIAEALGSVDVLVSPTSSQLAPSFEEAYASTNRRRPSYTGLYNMTGLPAISVNCGFVDGLPVGLQIAGRPFAESTVLQVAYAYERAAGWYSHHPSL